MRLPFLSVYAPQAGLSELEKEHFYNQLQGTVATIPVSEFLFLVGDWNGHIGDDAGAYYQAYGGKGLGI